MTYATALLERPAQYFLRTPEGRKGVSVPKGLSDAERSDFLLEQTNSEADRVGWAILDEVETRPRVHIVKDADKAVAVQAARTQGKPKQAPRKARARAA